MNDPRIGLNVGLAGRPAPIAPARDGYRRTDEAAALTGSSFKTMLAAQSLKFSQHAEQRLAQRGIKIAPEQLERIASAVDQASAKGARDSLVFCKNMAMIVNVPSRTVITAMDEQSMRQHIFTNIDSAVFIN
ncbi:TIGR02530 family flagellar biosynthesis protein [Cohnella sp. 56]|uniref:TIGR02530 family flagellar biosynthesis protein n=1 Tax=Cohnella sp. 56 TaxID=3113722 RepID=UPI0030EAF80F